MERILITGASRGIGRSAALAMARPGRHLILAARSHDRLETMAHAVRLKGAAATVQPIDLARADAADELVTLTGPVDGLVLNAGRSNNRALHRLDQDAIQTELQLNYLTPLGLVRGYLPTMRTAERGCIVAVGSLTSLVPFPGNATYAASKAALYMMLRSLRGELEGTGIHVGIVLPGYTDTEMARSAEVAAPALGLSADTVGEAIALCYDKRRGIVIPGALNRAAARLFGAFPQSTDRVFHRVNHWFGWTKHA